MKCVEWTKSVELRSSSSNELHCIALYCIVSRMAAINFPPFPSPSRRTHLPSIAYSTLASSGMYRPVWVFLCSLCRNCLCLFEQNVVGGRRSGNMRIRKFCIRLYGKIKRMGCYSFGWVESNRIESIFVILTHSFVFFREQIPTSGWPSCSLYWPVPQWWRSFGPFFWPTFLLCHLDGNWRGLQPTRFGHCDHNWNIRKCLGNCLMEGIESNDKDTQHGFILSFLYIYM